MTPSPPDVHPEHGRRYLTWALAFLVITDLAVTATYVARIGFGNFPQQLVRLALLLALGYFLLRARAWARWVLLALMLLAVWSLLPMVLRQGAFDTEKLPATLPPLVMLVGYVFVARGLMYSKSVQAFFRAHREPPAPVAAGQADSGLADG